VKIFVGIIFDAMKLIFVVLIDNFDRTLLLDYSTINVYFQVEAIRAFVHDEVMTGDNKYNCSNCGSLQDARKGLCFQKLPYLMCVQLRRTEYDFVSMTRKKVNDR